MDLVEWADRAAPAAFDYSSLDPAVASLVRASAGCIKEQLKKQHAVFLEIGREFLMVKDQLGHGDFGLWLDAEFGINERTAQRCIRAAELLGDKPNIASALPQIALVELAAPSTPEHVRETVVQRIAAGEQMKPMAVLAMIKAARQAEKEKKRTAALAKMSPEEREAYEQKEKRRHMIAQQREEEVRSRLMATEVKEERQLDAALEAVALLKSRMTADELARLSQLIGVGRSAFDGLLVDAAGMKPDDFHQQWVHMAHKRPPTAIRRPIAGE
jgi:hypothetical protein